MRFYSSYIVYYRFLITGWGTIWTGDVLGAFSSSTSATVTFGLGIIISYIYIAVLAFGFA